MISIDYSLIAEIVLFLILMFTLNKLLYQQVLAKMNDRKKILDEENSLIQESRKKKKKFEKEIQAVLRNTRKKTMEIILSETERAEEEKQRMVANALKQAEKLMEQHKHVIDQQALKTKQDIKKQVSFVAKEITRKIIPILLLSAFIVIAPVNASEHSDVSHTEHSSHVTKGHISNEIPKLVNFTLMVAILFYILKPITARTLEQRSHRIKKTLEDTQNALNSELSSLKTYKKEVKIIASTTEKKIQEAHSTAETRKVQLLETGKKEIESIFQDIELKKEHYTVDVKKQLKEQLIMDVISFLERSFAEGLDWEMDRRLVKDSIQKLDSFEPFFKGL